MPELSPRTAKTRKSQKILKALLPRHRHAFEEEGINVDHIDDNVIETVGMALKEGQIGIFPTETVYGLVGSAQSDSVIERILEIKQRDRNKPLPVQVASLKDVPALGVELNAYAESLARNFWPGPLTLVLPFLGPEHCRCNIAGLLLAQWSEKKTVAVRIPQHPVAALVLRMAGIPLVATSANLSGGAPVTRIAQIEAPLRNKVDWILDGGPSEFARESTVVLCDKEGWRILREGALRGILIQKSLAEATAKR